MASAWSKGRGAARTSIRRGGTCRKRCQTNVNVQAHDRDADGPDGQDGVPERVTFHQLVVELGRRIKEGMEQHTERVDSAETQRVTFRTRQAQRAQSMYGARSGEEGTSDNQDESLVADIFRSEAFQQAGILLSIGAVLVVAVIFRPPADDRCTLPWC